MALQISFPFGRLVDVFVTHVDESCGSFFVQVINEDAEKLNQLMQDIEQSVNDGTAQTVRSNDILVGGVYLAKFEDGGWYRARVLGLSPEESKCEVVFIDYGNSDFVPLPNIRKANEEFLKLSPQAFECELNQLERFKGDSFSALKDKILEQELFCHAVSLKKNGTIVADLFTDPDGRSSVLDTIAEAGNTTSSSLTVPANTARKDLKYKTVSVKLDSYQDVVVSHLGDPERFCCQLISHTEDLQTVMSQLTEEYSELSSDTLALKSCSLGRACCAKFADDGGWYRAMITGVGSVASGFVEVKFVDYGNSQKTPLTDVKEITEELAWLPAQAFECTLSGVAPAEGQWSDEAKSLFGKLTKEKHMVGLISGQEADGRYQVKLYDTTSDSDLEVPNVLVAAGYAQKTSESKLHTPHTTGVSVASFTAQNANPAPSNPVYSLEKLNPGSSERVLVPAADNPTKFYCQLFRTSQKLEDLMRGVETHYSGLRGDEGIISSPAVGDPCCAKFSEDNCWYRAEVTNVDKAGKTTVQFVDYGNSEVVARSNIRQLLPKFSELPRQAIECSLNRIRPKSHAWSSGEIKKFYELAVEKEGKVEVITEESSGVYRVELTRRTKTGNVNISEQLVAVNAAALLEGAVATTENLESMQNKEFTEVAVVVGNYEDVFVSHFEDPLNFWCQNVALIGELDTLMESIEKYYSGPGQKDVVRSPFLGMSCIASYSFDNGWYRGKVTGLKKGNQVEVQFVDYGNSEVMPLSNVRDIKREFMQLPAQAFKCALESILFDGMSWPQNALDKFNELTAEKELVGRVDAFDKNKGAHHILLLNTSQGKNLNIGDEITALLPQDSKPTIPQLKLKSGDRESVVVTSVSGPMKIFCQVQRTANELDGLMLDIDRHYRDLGEQQSRVDQPVVGGFYMAKYSVDEAWFRAKVTQVNPSSVEVYYVDYGNSETLPFSEVKQLAAKFAILPVQCVECSLAGDIQGVSDESFKELTLDMEFVANVLSVKNSGVAKVELYLQDTKESLLNQLSKSAEKKPVEKKPVSAGTFQHVAVPSLDIQPNTREDVYVTTVESVEKIFCQLSKNVSELDEVMEEIEKYYRPLDQQQERLTSPSTGDWCVAKFSVDDGWYRAQLSSIQGSGAEVLYIDYGNSETVSLADVKVLKPEFATVPAQAFSCSLAGCKAGVAVDAKFKEIAFENEFIANIVSVQNNKVQVDLFTKDTEKSIVDMLQPEGTRSEVSESVTVANLEIEPGTKELTTITAVESMTKFYCQLNQNTEALDQMMNSIDEYYAVLGESQECIDAPSVGDFCMATFSEDGGWYRARITDVGSCVDVFYIDYGNSESLPVKSIKKLHPQFVSLPAQAIECCLKGASSSVDILEKEFETHFLLVGSSGAMEVNLISTATGEDVLSTLGASQVQSNNKGFKALPGLFVEEYADVCPVTVYGPHNFSCQVMNKQQIESLRHLMDSIQTHYNTLEPGQGMLQFPAAGMTCCALFPEDNLWYHSIITGVPSEDTVDVTYVDYGNYETVALSDVRVLEAEFMKDPLQSVACSLANIKPVDGSCWSEAVVERFEALVLQKQLVAKIVKKEGNSMEVELFDTSDDYKDVNIGAQLVEEKFALSTTHPQTMEQPAAMASTPQPATSNKAPKITKLSQLERTKPAASETVYVTAVVSPVRFYCQIEGIEDKLQTLMDDLSMFYEVLASGELTRKEWGVGDLCCAQFCEDELWYRAVVEQVSAQGTAEVRFVDYGNGEMKELTAIKELKEDFTTVPPFAIECCLSGARPPNGSSWTSEEAATFEQLTEYKALTANFKNQAEPIEVELMEGSANLIQKLQEAGVVAGEVPVTGKHAIVDKAAVPLASSPGHSKTKKLDYISPALKIGDEKKAFVTCVTTPGWFYCQLSENTAELDDLMDDLNSYCCQLDETEGCLISPVDGQPCVALFSTDGMWYRARVLSLTVNSVEVLFVDYGNTEVIKPKELKSMEPKYMKLPIQAIECSLDLSKRDWTVEHGITLDHMTKEEGGDGEVDEKEVSLKVTGQQDGRYEVKVLEGTTCISDNLLAQITGSEGASVLAVAQTSEASALEFSEIEIDAGVAKEGYVSYTISAQDFYIQLTETFPHLCEMMDEIAAVYSGGVNGVHVDSLKPGLPCVALFASDGGWYRGTVKKILSDKEVEVEYVDYGNCARVPVGDVKPLYSKFADLPKQAIHCKLSSGKESFAANGDQLFSNAVENKSLTTVFTTLDNSIWTVTLSDEDISITELLIVGAGAAAAMPLSADTFKINELVTEEIVEGLTERVYIAHVENPGEFYLQFVSSTAALDGFTAALTEGYSAMQPSDCLLRSFDVGTSCCALFSLDGQWYRAVIRSVIDGEVTVHFIDYGNSETVKADQVKELNKAFVSLPQQAVCCSLDVAKDSWSSRECASFEKIVSNEEEFVAKFGTQVGNKWHVSLERNGSSVLETLLSQDAGASETMLEVRKLDSFPITPGQTAVVYISHVNDPGNFFVQISETTAILEELTSQIEGHYACLGSNDSSLEKCEVGSVCCVPFTEDNCFYRAIVTSILSDLQVEVEFVDFGNSDTVPMTSIKSLTPDLAKPPCQAVRCGLMDIKSNRTDEYTAVLEALFDKPLQATFVKREESTWMVVIEHEAKCINKIEELQATGISQVETKLSVDIPVNVEQSEFAIVPITPGQSAEVYLVHANDPSSFYVQCSESAADLETLITQIEDIYPSLGPTEESFDSITVNSLCCAQFEEDHQWYRAIVRNLATDSMVEVEFVDYGNTQLVALSSVKLLRKEFMKLPRQAIHCGMVNVKTHWTDEDIKVFHGILGEKPINASFICQEGAIWLLQLDCEGVCVNEHEQFKKVSEIPGVETKEEKQEIVLNSYTEPVLGYREPVYLLSTESTDILWLQVAITEEELETLMTNIARCSDLDKLESSQLREGLPCLGMFTEDDKLYRACVVEYNTESVHLLYVDYGNSEWVPLDRLRIIRDEFMQLPSQAFQCKLEGVKEVNIDQLFELCDQKLLEVETISQEPSGHYVLKLFDPDDKLINELVSAVKYAAAESPLEATMTSEERTFSRTEFKAGDSLTMFVTVVDSPNSLWCQLDDPENKLEQLIGEIDDCYSKLQNEEFQLQSPTPGAMCCGQYTANDVWYRAEVLDVCDDGKISVHFVDYGNDEHLPQARVKKLLEQFQVLPVQAVNCSLFGVDPANGECWSEDANEKFHDLCSDKSLVGKIHTVSNSVLEVDLTDKEDSTGLSLNSQLIAAGLARESRKLVGEEKPVIDSAANEDLSSKLVYNLLNLSVGSKATVTVTNTVNPGQFWCQVTESSDELLSLMEELERYYTTTPELDLTMPSIGLPCCAKFAEDEQWYRAVIIDIGTDIEVCYVDYGNTAKLPLSDIKIMNEPFLALPVQALQCSLDGANPDADGIWQVDGTEYFQGLVHDQEMELTVVAVESGKYVITLSSASGVDLGTAMSGEVPLEVPPMTSFESPAVPDKEMPKQEAAETKGEQGSSTDECHMQPGPTENGAEEATAIDERVVESPECHSEDTQLESVEQEVAASPSTEEESFEDTVEQVEATEEHAVPDDESTGENTSKVGEETAEAEKSGVYDEVVKQEALEDADDTAEDEETNSLGSEEFVEARQDSSEEIAAITGNAEDVDRNGSAEFDATGSHGLKSSAEELESDTKTESGGVLTAKDDEKFLDEVRQLVQSDGSSLIPLAGASDAGDSEMEDDSEDLVLSDEALEILNRELDQEEIDVVRPTEKPEEQLLPRGEPVVTSEEMCKKENSEDISIGHCKPSEEMCKKENDKDISTSDSKVSEEMCKKDNGEEISTSESKASEDICKKDNGEGISTSDDKASEEMCKKDNGEEILTNDSKASEEMCKKDNGEEISTSDSKASEKMCEDSDEDVSVVAVDMSTKGQDFASRGDGVPELATTVTVKEDLKTADNQLNVSELDDKDHTPTTEDVAATCSNELTPEDRVVTLDAVSKINEDSDKLVGEESISMVENQAEAPEMDDSVTLAATNVPEKERPNGETDSAVVEAVSCDLELDIMIPDEQAKEVDVSESVSEESTRPRDTITDDDDDDDTSEAAVDSTVQDEEKPADRAQQTNGMMTNGHKEAEDESTMQDIALEDEIRVTAVTGDGHFWSHFSSLTNPAGLYELQESMNEYYGDEEKLKSDLTWKEGDLCAALCTGGNQWCRAEVTSVNTPSTPGKKKAGFLSRLLSKKSEDAEPSEMNCTVTLLDSGAQETVPLNALQPLDASFQDLPHQAKLCHLDAASDWAPQGVERLEELLAHKIFRAVIRKGVGDILTCPDVPLTLFPSKDGDETTGYTENEVGKPTESINQKLQSEGLVQL